MNRNQFWVIGSVLLIIVLVVGGYFLGVKPQLDAAATADLERADVAAQNAALATDVAALREQYENIDEIQMQLDELRLAVPDSASIDEFIGELRSLEVAHGVTLATLSVADASPFVPNELLAATIDPAVDLPNLVTIPVGVQVLGSPGAVLSFIQGLQSMDRLYLVSNFSLTYDGDGSATADIGGLLYVLLDPSVAQPAPAGNPGTPTPAPADTGSPTPTPTPTVSPTPGG